MQKKTHYFLIHQKPHCISRWEWRAEQLGPGWGLEAHTPTPSNGSFTRGINGCLFSGDPSGLDAFSLYDHGAWLPGNTLSDNR